MPFELRHAVIHSFTKEQNTSMVSEVVKKNSLLDVRLPAVLSLVSGISGLLGKPGNIVSYGQFGDDMRQGPFPSAFSSYSADASSAAIFLAISHVAIDELVKEAAEETFSTGGLILVANYLNGATAYYLIAMIKQRGAVTLTADYVPIEISEIDLTKVYQAARININRYMEVSTTADASGDRPETAEEEEEDKSYLCFLGQKQNNQASGYFIKALGCTKGIASSRATKNAIQAVEKYFRDNTSIKRYRTSARDAVISYLQRKASAGEHATVDDICHAAIACVPPEESEIAAGLKEFLNNEQNKVPAQFPVHTPTLNRTIRIKGDAGNWSIQFEQQILGTTSNSIVCYNKASKTITINSLPDDLIKSIEKELGTRSLP